MMWFQFRFWLSSELLRLGVALVPDKEVQEVLSKHLIMAARALLK